MGMAGEGRETSLFTMGCCAHSALGLSDFPALGLGNVKKKKKSHFFNIFFSLLLVVQRHFPLPASMSAAACSCVTRGDPVGQAQRAETARIKMCVLCKHVGPSSEMGAWVTRLQQKASKHHPARGTEQGVVTWVISAAGGNQHHSVDIGGAAWSCSCKEYGPFLFIFVFFPALKHCLAPTCTLKVTKGSHNELLRLTQGSNDREHVQPLRVSSL